MLCRMSTPFIRSSLPRRLAAITYDSLVLLGLFLLVTLAFVIVTQGAATEATRLLLRLALASVGFGFFSWFWVHGGQTVGMRTWRLRVVSRSGDAVTWGQALRRCLFALVSWAPFGLGFIWSLVDRERLTWHDRLSGTRLVLLPKK